MSALLLPQTPWTTWGGPLLQGAALLLSSFAGHALAQTPEDEGRAFLRSLTAVDEKVLGKLEYRKVYYKTDIGRIAYDVSRSEYEGRPAYLFRAEGNQNLEELPGGKGTLRAEAYLTPSLACLSWHNVEIREDAPSGKRTERVLDCKVRGNRMERVLTIDGKVTERSEVPYEDGLLVGPAQGPLLFMLMAVSRPRALAFTALAEGRRVRVRLEIGREEEITVGGVALRGVVVVKTSEPVDPPPAGRKTEVLSAEYLWMSSDRRMLVHAFRDNPQREELLTDEVRKRLADPPPAPEGPPGPRDAVVRFFHAMAKGNREGIRDILDLDRFFEDRARTDERFASLPPGQLQLSKAQFLDALAARSSDENVRRAGIYTADFFEENLSGEEAEVTFAAEFRRAVPALDRSRFRLYRSAAGWRIYRIEN